MKRALAERAKESHGAAAAPPPPTRTTTTTTTTATAEEPDGWFLKFQNKALATELRVLKEEVEVLSKERDTRRDVAAALLSSMLTLEQSWHSLDTSLLSSLSSLSSLSVVSHSNDNVERLLHKFTQQLNHTQEQPSTTSTTSTSTLDLELLNVLSSNSSSNSSSTGDGKSVEYIGAVVKVLYRLAASSSSSSSSSSSMEQITERVSNRIQMLQAAVTALLRHIDTPPHNTNTTNNTNTTTTNNTINTPSSSLVTAYFDTMTLRAQLSQLKSDLQAKQDLIDELVISRDQSQRRESSLKRKYHRMLEGGVQLPGASAASSSNPHPHNTHTNTSSSYSNTTSTTTTHPTTTNTNPNTTNSNSIQTAATDETTKKRLEELETVARTREKQIQELLAEHQQLHTKISELSTVKTQTGPSLEEISSSKPYVEMKCQLDSSLMELSSLKAERESILSAWSEAKASVQYAQKAAEQIAEQHQKSWKEVVGDEFSATDSTSDSNDSPSTKRRRVDDDIESAIKTEHKLRQALEGARQADNYRISLDEATALAQSLEEQVQEWKQKYEEACKSNDSNKSAGQSTSESIQVTPSSPEGGTNKSTKGEISYEKLKKDNIKLKQNITVLFASKEAAKSKAEKAEAQREALSKSNARLLEQSNGKDEINAQSLATILHLKHQVEMHASEKKAYEEKAKATEQLLFAAKLSTTMEDRLLVENKLAMDEIQKNLKNTEEKLYAANERNSKLEKQIEALEIKIGTMENNLLTSQNRSEELISDIASKKQKIIRLEEELSTTKREAVSNKKAAASAVLAPNEQFAAYLQKLKKQVMCPVCNNATKDCILLSCRHMHCKGCVEKNIKNRSRKCPSCNLRFDPEKDLADIWL